MREGTETSVNTLRCLFPGGLGSQPSHQNAQGSPAGSDKTLPAGPLLQARAVSLVWDFSMDVGLSSP